MRNINKFRGCLTGGAAGDALGYAVEFLTKDKIFSMYGKSGNILGAYLGYDAIPQKYKDNLELHDLILQLSDDLCGR